MSSAADESTRSPAVTCSTDHLINLGAIMAFMFEKLEVYQKAVDLWRQLVAVEPTHKDAWDALGLAYEKLGNELLRRSKQQ